MAWIRGWPGTLILNYPESFHFIGEGQAIRGVRGWPAITQAIHGHQTIHGWPGSAVGPEQVAALREVGRTATVQEVGRTAAALREVGRMAAREADTVCVTGRTAAREVD